MCGLFGALSSTLTTIEVERAEFLGYLSGTRGMHSTGVAAVGWNKKRKKVYNSHKSTLPAPLFLGSSKYSEMMNTVDTPMVYMGHARLATIGQVNTENAQPIVNGKTIVCHNGTVHRFAPRKEDEATETDSKELVRRLVSKGLFKTLHDAEHGAYALTIMSIEKNSISFVRNKERELWFLDVGGTVYWASEKWMLQALCNKTGMTGNIFLLPVGKVHRYQFGSVDLTEVDVPEPEVKQYNGPFRWNSEKDSQNKTMKTGADTTGSVPLIGPHKSNYVGLYAAFEGNVIPLGSAAKILKKGCTNCKKEMRVIEPATWWDHDKVLCEDCIENPLVKNFITSKHYTYYGSIVHSYAGKAS